MAINKELLDKLQEMRGWKKSKDFYATKLGITVEEVSELWKHLIDKPEEKEVEFKEDMLKGEGEITFKSTREIHNLDELIKESKIDTNKWEITKYVQNYWGNAKEPHWQVKAWLSKKTKSGYSLQDFEKFLSKWEPSKFYREVRSLVDIEGKPFVDVELNIADFHLAKKTFQKDTSNSKTFDYYKTVEDLVSKVKSNYNINKLVFPISNDFFHSDTYNNTTTNGTPQDVTMWYHEEYERGFDILATTIAYLLTQANNVEVILVQGNHDRTKAFYVAHALEVLFKGSSGIKFQREHSVVKHTVLGNTFIGYHHGNTKNLEHLPLLFASSPNSSLDYGKAKYREIHTGDKHHYMAKEINGSGVRIQQMPSLSGVDRWHEDNGFVNNIRAALALVYDPEKGKIAEFEHRI